MSVLDASCAATPRFINIQFNAQNAERIPHRVFIHLFVHQVVINKVGQLKYKSFIMINRLIQKSIC